MKVATLFISDDEPVHTTVHHETTTSITIDGLVHNGELVQGTGTSILMSTAKAQELRDVLVAALAQYEQVAASAAV